MRISKKGKKRGGGPTTDEGRRERGFGEGKRKRVRPARGAFTSLSEGKRKYSSGREDVGTNVNVDYFCGPFGRGKGGQGEITMIYSKGSHKGYKEGGGSSTLLIWRRGKKDALPARAVKE